MSRGRPSPRRQTCLKGHDGQPVVVTGVGERCPARALPLLLRHDHDRASPEDGLLPLPLDEGKGDHAGVGTAGRLRQVNEVAVSIGNDAGALPQHLCRHDDPGVLAQPLHGVVVRGAVQLAVHLLSDEQTAPIGHLIEASPEASEIPSL